MNHPSFREKLTTDGIICGQGYLFELERRGYLQAGPFVPEAVLDAPEVVRAVHRDFVHAGSDVVEALTYYAHRSKLRFVHREDALEASNRQALKIAREVAQDHGALFAGNICNTNAYEPGDSQSHREIRAMYEEQVGWIAQAEADFVIGETFAWLGEAQIALEVVREAELPAVITLAVPSSGRLFDEVEADEACKRLEDAGATVVGLNCFRGPATMLPLVERICNRVSCPVAALPVPFRTHEREPTFFELRDREAAAEVQPFPTALEPLTCTRYEMADASRRLWELGARYIGGCCGTGPHHLRAMAEALGRRPPASRYSADLRRHDYYGEGDLRFGPQAGRSSRADGR